MVKVHRAVVERLGPGPVRALLLDTPFGFQTNATEIAARTASYFRDSVGATLEVAGVRSAADLEGPGGDAVIAGLVAAGLIFAGPGSPTYALRQWRGTLVPSVLAEKLAFGGALTFSSAAALTLGVVTVPVYEVYKVGETPHWAAGLDLLAPLGLPVALIPHYDNAEGGTHDTRFCYLGEDRLAALEQELPDDAFVLGVDEHTALCVDLDAGTAAVVGHGGVTVRVRGRSARIEAGEEVPFDRIAALAADLAAGGSGPAAGTTGAAASPATTTPVSGPGPGDDGGGPPLLGAIRLHEAAFRAAREAADAAGMVAAVLALDDELWAWSADTLQSDALDRGRASLRAMVAELGAVAERGTRDPATVLAPFVDLALALREAARAERRFADADGVRDRLTALGVEVRDTEGGSEWSLVDGAGPG
jgi:cyanophycinase-like exopeptidase